MIVGSSSKAGKVAWSPFSGQRSRFIACGTPAGSFSDVFSEGSASLNLEIMELGADGLESIGSVDVPDRFWRLAWSSFTGAEDMFPLGVIAGACVDGEVQLWDPSKIIDGASSEEAQVATLGKHEGEVKGLDWNKMHILASGGSDGNIYVWDMKKYPNHATVCPISASLGEITSVAWNRSIPRILGASLGIGQTVVWDLQSKKSICKIKDPNHSFRTSTLAWNPSVATQLVVASEDDKYSCMQLWDLRKAVSPVEVYSGHDSGILGVSWCEFDPTFILTSGMDNRALCWDYRKNCVVLEFPAQPSWVHDIKWSHSEAGMVAASSFDEVSVYSVHGMSSYVRDTAEDGFTGTEVVGGQTPPSWLRRPCGAQIGFGGRLVSFSGRHVHLTPCISDDEFAKSAKALSTSLREQSYAQFVESMVASSEKEDDKETWKVMRALFTDDTRKVILDHFKYNKTEIQQQWSALDFAKMSADKVSDSYVGGDVVERLLSRAVMVGDFKTAVEGCLRSNRLGDALILAVLGGEDLWKETRQQVLDRRMDNLLGKVISTAVSRDLFKFVDESSIEHWQDSLAMICTYATDDFASLARALGNRVVESNPHAAKLCFMVAGDLHRSFAMWLAEATEGSESMEALTPAAAVRSGGGTLQNVVAKICVFMRAIGQDKLVEENGENEKTLQNMADILTNYALILCSQGLIEEALFCLDVLNLPSHERSVSLRERIHHMLSDDDQDMVKGSHGAVPKEEHRSVGSEFLPDVAQEDSTMSEAPLETEHYQEDYDGHTQPESGDGVGEATSIAASPAPPLVPMNTIPPATQEYSHPGYSQSGVYQPPVAGALMPGTPLHTMDVSMSGGVAPVPPHVPATGTIPVSEGYGGGGGFYGSGMGAPQPIAQQHSSMMSSPFTTTTIEPSAEKSSASMDSAPSDPLQVDISNGPSGITYVRDVLINTMNACYSDPSSKRKRDKVSLGISGLLTFVMDGKMPVDVVLDLAKELDSKQWDEILTKTIFNLSKLYQFASKSLMGIKVMIMDAKKLG